MGKGQLLGYPIFSLKEHRDLHLYLRFLETVLIDALGKLGLAVNRREGKTGLWVEERKIVAIGVAVSRWISYHGFAINLNNDLKPYEWIVPWWDF